MLSHISPIEVFGSTQLCARDFDNTEALTMHPSPNNIDVATAYRMAVDSVFGTQAGDAYDQAGGLRNRTPREVVAGLAIGASSEEVDHFTDRLITEKLAVLEAEIGRHPDGKIWPHLSEGFPEFKEGLHAAQVQGRLIDDAVVSSGHTSFIKKVYDLWGLPYPNIFVTTESVQAYIPPYTPEELAKPAPGLVTLTHLLWQRHRDVCGVAMSSVEAARMVGVGDDDAKDGDMFRASGVKRFHLIHPDTARAVWEAVSVDLGIRRIGVEVRHAS